MRAVVLLCCLVVPAGADNLLRNAGFEQVDDRGLPLAWEWSPGRAAGTCQVVETPRSGRRALKLTNPTPLQPHVFSFLAQTARVAPATTYTLSCYARGGAAGCGWLGGGPEWTTRAGFPAPAGETWQRVTATFRTPPIERAWRVMLLLEDRTDGVLIDDVQLEEGDVATAYQEPEPLAPGVLQIRLTAAPAERNRLPNPSFEAAEGNLPAGWIWDPRNTQATCALSEPGHTGARCVKLTNGTPFGAHVYGQLRLPADLPVEPGRDYTFSYWCRTDGPPGTAWFGGGAGWLVRLAVPETTAWRRVTHTFRVGAESAIPVMIVTESPTAGVFIDDVQLEPGTIATPFNAPGTVLPAAVQIGLDTTAEPARWKPERYPPGQVAFATDALRCEAAISLPAPGPGSIEVLVRDGERVLARRTIAPGGGLPAAALLGIAFGLPEPAPERLTVAVAAHDAAGAELASSEHAPRIIGAGRVVALLETVAARQPALEAAAREDDYARVTATVARNFVGFAREDLAAGDLARAWDQAVTLEAQTGAALAAPRRPRAPRWVTSPLTIAGPTFEGEVRLPDGTIERRPVYFTGYGHFGAVRRDIEEFPGYGQNIVQVEFGPNSLFPADGELNLGAVEEFRALCARAAAAGVAVNLLLSPHYLPDWVVAKYPQIGGVNGGFLRYSVYAPESRALLERFLREVIPRIRDLPALHSICLSNEPLCLDARACPTFTALWRDWLRARYGTIAAVNARWRTALTDFDAVAVPEPAFEPSARCGDFVRFQQEAFAGWHRWLAEVIHSLAPELPVHAKIMIGAHFTRHLPGFWSIAPELFAGLSQINGNDCWKPPGATGRWACGWLAENMGYDYQRSAADLPVFNSENHHIPDRTLTHVTPEYLRNVVWQGAIHGQGAETTWVWERTFDPASDFAGSILHRPECVEAKGWTALDLMRAGREVAAIAAQPAPLAILWSQTAAIWDGDAHERAVRATYTAANFVDLPVGFVNDRDLEAFAAGRPSRALDAARLLLVPHAVHLPAAAPAALARWAAGGGKLVVIGPPPERDDTDAPLAGLPELEEWPDELATGDGDALWARLRPIAPGPLVPIAVFGVEVRSATLDGARIANLCNYLNQPATVRLPAGCVDVLTGERLGAELELPPLVPRLVRFE